MESPRAHLHRLINPRSIAVIGATASPGKVGRRVMEALAGSDTTVIPVHPKHEEVLGVPVIHHIDELPPGVDLAVVATGAEPAVDAAQACAAHGIPFVVVLAGGFSETGEGGAALEAQLAAIPKATGTRILGPNTLGFQITGSGVDTIFVDHAAESIAGGGTVLISQSGSVAVEALLSAQRYGFSIKAFIGLGNKADLGEIDFLAHFADDPETTCLCLYIEDLSGGRPLLQLIRDIVPNKPVLAIKAGRTKTGAHAASSHTGRLSGSDRVIDGALRQYCVQRVDNDEELCDAAKALTLCPVPAGPRVAVLTPAGGYGVMLADLIESPARRATLQMAELSDETRARLRERMLGFASVTNPVDLTASVDDEAYAAALEAVLADDNVDMAICVLFFAPPGMTRALIQMLAGIIRGAPKPVVVLAGDEDGTGGVLRELYAAGVAAFPSLVRTVDAVRNLYMRRILLGRSARTTSVEGRRESGVVRGASKRPGGRLDEHEAKQLATSYGLHVPPSMLVAGDAAGLARPAFPDPYVVKVCSADILHKTERGGVRLGVGASELPQAVEDMKQKFPGSAVLVEQQLSHAGIELIIGAYRDPELGPCVMAGAGGILAELHKDVAFRLLPCGRSEAQDMLDELVIAPVFDGYRGLGCARDAFVDAIVAVSRLVVDLGDAFAELDLNPVVCSSDGLCVLDAALVTREAGSSG